MTAEHSCAKIRPLYNKDHLSSSFNNMFFFSFLKIFFIFFFID